MYFPLQCDNLEVDVHSIQDFNIYKIGKCYLQSLKVDDNFMLNQCHLLFNVATMLKAQLNIDFELKICNPISIQHNHNPVEVKRHRKALLPNSILAL